MEEHTLELLEITSTLVKMSKPTSFEKQFLGGYFPQEHWDESTRENGHEVSSASSTRKRQGVSLGSQQDANPGMTGKNDFSRLFKEKRRK